MYFGATPSPSEELGACQFETATCAMLEYGWNIGTTGESDSPTHAEFHRLIFRELGL